MAAITVSGTVTGRTGESPVTLKVFDSGDTVASFSVADLQYVYTKQGEDRQGQFYRAEVRGKAAEIASERISRGDKITVSGQLVQRTYNDKLYLDIKNAQITYLESRQKGSSDSEDPPF